MHVSVFVSLWVSDRTGGYPGPDPESEENCPLTGRNPERVQARFWGMEEEETERMEAVLPSVSMFHFYKFLF